MQSTISSSSEIIIVTMVNSLGCFGTKIIKLIHKTNLRSDYLLNLIKKRFSQANQRVDVVLVQMLFLLF